MPGASAPLAASRRIAQEAISGVWRAVLQRTRHLSESCTGIARRSHIRQRTADLFRRVRVCPRRKSAIQGRVRIRTSDVPQVLTKSSNATVGSLTGSPVGGGASQPACPSRVPSENMIAAGTQTTFRSLNLAARKRCWASMNWL